MNKITFVLTCVNKDFVLSKTCVNSIISLFNNEEIDIFYIITHYSDIELFKNFFSKYNFIKIINQSDIYQNNISYSGWHTQQVLKLNISKIINTDYYIILDADCYLTKKISYKDLIYDNKPILSLIEKHRNNWLIKSCEYYNLDYEKLPNLIPSVTPQLMNTKIVKELLESNPNIPFLINNDCNEFWLYFCYLLKNYDFSEIYYIDINKQLTNSGVWINENIKNNSILYTINSQFNDEYTIFTLFQSNMHVPYELYLPIINENVSNKII